VASGVVELRVAGEATGLLEDLARGQGLSVHQLAGSLAAHPATAALQLHDIVRMVQKIGKTRGMKGREKAELALEVFGLLCNAVRSQLTDPRHVALLVHAEEMAPALVELAVRPGKVDLARIVQETKIIERVAGCCAAWCV